jgi:hypothetical protein
MATPAPFSVTSKTATLSVTSTSGDIALPTAGAATIMLTNEGPNHCYLAVGQNAQTATVPSGTFVATATPVLANSQVSYSMDQTLTVPHLAAICGGSGTCTLRISVGEGV